MECIHGGLVEQGVCVCICMCACVHVHVNVYAFVYACFCEYMFVHRIVSGWEQGYCALKNSECAVLLVGVTHSPTHRDNSFKIQCYSLLCARCYLLFNK